MALEFLVVVTVGIRFSIQSHNHEIKQDRSAHFTSAAQLMESAKRLHRLGDVDGAAMALASASFSVPDPGLLFMLGQLR